MACNFSRHAIFPIFTLMRITLHAFGIARDILEGRSVQFDTQSETPTIGDLKHELCAFYPGFSTLAKLSFAVNEAYVDDAYALGEGDEVVLIPPVSGG
jgi:molybdopterin converting factor small subunit